MNNKLIYKNNRTLWINNFREFIKNKIFSLLSLGEGKEIDRLKEDLISNEAMIIWIKGFTHISFNPNPDSNYEMLEHLGDKVSKLAFGDYVIKKYPTISEGEASELIRYYMSKMYQSKISRENLELSKWVLINTGINVGIEEDLFESLFGVLMTVGDKIKGGLGYSLCYNLIFGIFKGIDIDLGNTEEHPMTVLKNILEKAGWYKSTKEKNKDITEVIGNWITSNGYRLILKLPGEAIEDLKKYYPDKFGNLNEILADVTANSKRDAKNKAYKKAIETLQSYGLDINWAEDFKMAKKMEDIETKELLFQAKQKLMSEGFLKLEIPKHIKSGENTYVQILGLDKNNRWEVIKTIEIKTKGNPATFEKEILKEYIRNGRDL